MDICIRPAVIADIPAMCDVASKSFSVPWSEKQFSDGLSSFSQFFFVCITNEKVVGYISLMSVANEGEILSVATEPIYRRQGIAKLLIEKAFEFFREKNCERVFLEVRNSNTPAIDLYMKFGFSQISQRKNYYSSPREDALIFEKTLII